MSNNDIFFEHLVLYISETMADILVDEFDGVKYSVRDVVYLANKNQVNILTNIKLRLEITWKCYGEKSDPNLVAVFDTFKVVSHFTHDYCLILFVYDVLTRWSLIACTYYATQNLSEEKMNYKQLYKQIARLYIRLLRSQKEEIMSRYSACTDKCNILEYEAGKSFDMI